jgi:hypothetical protein
MRHHWIWFAVIGLLWLGGCAGRQIDETIATDAIAVLSNGLCAA